MNGFKRLKQEGLVAQGVVAVLVIWFIGVLTGVALILSLT